MRKKKKKRFKIRPIIIVMAIILLMGGFINRYKANSFNFTDENGGWMNPFDIFEKKNERVNVLVFGVDSSSKEESDRSRSDSIMLVTIDAEREKPAVISIPRDTRVKIPGRKNFDKINHAHAYGGPELLVETVEQLFDININYYVRINYNAVIEVVDALGGVEIDVPLNMKYSDPYATPPLNINIKKGLQVLNGEQSVQFMRFRKGYANQDLGRIQAQQQFVHALLDKVISPSTILKVPELIDIVYKNVDTNIPKKEMISLGLAASSIDTENLNKITLEGTPKTMSGISYYVVEEESINEMKTNYLSDLEEISAESD